MADDLTITARLRNEISGPAKAARGDVAELGNEVTRTNAKEAAGAGGTRALAAAHNDAEKAVGRLHTRLLGLSGDLTGKVASGLKIGALALGGITAAAAVFGLKAASNFQQTRVAFDTMLGSVDAGGRLFNQLQALNLKSPFELSQITQATQVLLRYGVAADTVVDVTKGIANAAALSGPKMVENLDSIALAIGQVQAKGTLQGQEARQLAEAGINAYGIYATALGKTRAEVEKLGEAGKLPANILLDAVAKGQLGIQGLDTAAEKLSQTLGGQLSNVKDLLNVGLADAAQPLVATLGQLIGTPDKPGALVGGLQAMVSTVGPPLFKLIGSAAELAAKALPVVGPVLDALVGGIAQLLAAAEPGLVALQPVAGDLARSLGDLVIALVPVMPDLVRAFVALVAVLPVMVDDLARIVPLVAPILTLLAGLLGLGPVRDLLAGVLTALLAYRAVNAIVTVIRDLSVAFRGLAVAETEEAAARTGAGGIGGLGAAGAPLAMGTGGVLLLSDAAKHKKTARGDLEIVGSGALLGAAIGTAVPIPGVGTAVGAGVGAVAGGIVVGLNHLNFAGFGGHGDTAGPRALNRTVAAHQALDAGLPGRRQVTNALYSANGPSSDHPRGRALDLVGSGLFAYANAVRAGGGFAEYHGDHLHAVYGDTPGPRSSSTTPSGAMGDRLPPIVFTGDFYGVDDVEGAVYRGIRRYQRDRAERGAPKDRIAT